jgi:AraC-like DNA-binding protein
MRKKRSSGGRAPHPGGYDEIHIIHEAEGTREPSGVEDGLGRSYLILIRKGARQRALSEGEVSEALRDWSPDLARLKGWRVSHLHVRGSDHPRCIKVVVSFARTRGGGKGREGAFRPPTATYFDSYDAIAHVVTALLPRVWRWFLDRADNRAQVIACTASEPGRTKARVAGPPVDNPLYVKLHGIIRGKVLDGGAIWAIADRFTLEVLARDLKRPRRTLERHLSNLYPARSPAVLIREIRLDIARELLATSATVKEVANRVGYSQSHFSKLFRAAFGTNPEDLLMR